MNLLQRQVAAAPEAWAAAFALAAIAAVIGRWLLQLAGLPPEGPVKGLHRFHPLVSYLTASQRVEPTSPSLAAGAWSDPFDPPRFASAPPATRPAQAARVTAILISQERRVAIIDGRILSVGDALPGAARIEAIEPDQVIINRGGRREVLRLLPLAVVR